MLANPWNNNSVYPFPNLSLQAKTLVDKPAPAKITPTIIRPIANSKKNIIKPVITVPDLSLPMPSIPPPSPPKDLQAFGVALYDYQASHPDDLPLQVS